MELAQFTRTLLDEGYAEPVTVNRAPDGYLDLHTHPFAAKALILEGEIELGVDQAVQVYRAGQIFQLDAHMAHTERYGPTGVTYLVGRK